MRLYLFDVDGTLLSARGAGRRAIGAALEEVYGTRGAVETYDFHGKTDPQILHDLMTDAGFAEATVRERQPEFFQRYVAHLAREVGDGAQVELYPGVAALVGELARHPGILLGLLTGNIEAGARIKLAPTGLLPHFRLGAYGSDAADRTRLPAVAAERARRLVGRAFEGSEVVVIGDTPLDIACARAFGARVVAVATGRHGVEELAAHAPDLLFPDFGDTRAVLRALLDGAG